MPVSFVLRLVPDALTQRRIVGRIESVETGEQASIQDAEELIGFLHAQGNRQSAHEQLGDPNDQAR
jgi:hypothetical protein